MSSDTSPESSSPQALGRKVQHGRIEKSKTRKEVKAPTYRIGGRTFACEACKKGHRVSKCTHASERPVSMTHDPGRPSGDQKRHCDCPKQCACTKRNCKCDRNCSCTQTMYMLVYVPMKDGDTGGEAKEGEWQIGQEVITDLHGKKLTEEEVKTRNQLKQMQLMAKTTAPTPGLLKPSPVMTTDASPPQSCCQHKKNIEEQKQPVAVQEPAVSIRRRPQCNCGTGCACAFCLDHPNNQTSHLLAQQQAAYFTNQTYGHQQINPPWASMQIGGSCMGTNPHFAISNTPNPSHSQFQTLFPAAGPASNAGYFISYPFTRYAAFVQPDFAQSILSPMLAGPMNVTPPMPFMNETLTSASPLQSSTPPCCHKSPDNDPSAQHETSSLDTFDFSNYDIGNAVASGWNGSDEFAIDQVFDPLSPTFANSTNWDVTKIEPLPDVGTASISEEAIQESGLLSPAIHNGVSSPFAIATDIPLSVAPAPNGHCSHQSCCQHGFAHPNAHSSHANLQTGIGLPFNGVPSPMTHGIYAHSPS